MDLVITLVILGLPAIVYLLLFTEPRDPSESGEQRKRWTAQHDRRAA